MLVVIIRAGFQVNTFETLWSSMSVPEVAEEDLVYAEFLLESKSTTA